MTETRSASDHREAPAGPFAGAPPSDARPSLLRGRRTLLGVLAVGVAVVVGVAAALGSSTPPAARAGTSSPVAKPPRVVTAEVARVPVSRTDLLYGVTRAPDRGGLAFTGGGRLVSRPVDVGQRVAPGDVLARLDAAPFRHGLSAAQATVDELVARTAQLERDRNRIEALLASGATSTQQAEQIAAQLDALRAALAAARAQAAEARRLVSESTLRAPYAATVTAVFLEEGEHARPGEPIVALSGHDGLEVEAEAPESVAARIAVGDPVEVLLPARRLRLTGRVRSVSRSGGERGVLFPVRVDVPSAPGAAPGLTARLLLPDQGAEALVVPLRAVLDPTGRRPSVFRVRDDRRVEGVAIEADGLSDGRVVVAAGLAEGDRVVVAGQGRLLDGDLVDVAEEEARR